MKDRYSVAEYARAIGKSRQAVNGWVKAGLFEGFTCTVGGVLYISADALQKFGNKRPVKNEAYSKVYSAVDSKEEIDNNSTEFDDDASNEGGDSENCKGVKQEAAYSKAEPVDSKVDSKDEFIAFLQAQLADRDRQIEEYKAQIAEYTDRFADLAKTGHEIAEKALQTTEQAHLLQLQAALPDQTAEQTLEQTSASEAGPPKKRGLFGLWKK